jgi:hypothetical protein
MTAIMWRSILLCKPKGIVQCDACFLYCCKACLTLTFLRLS